MSDSIVASGGIAAPNPGASAASPAADPGQTSTHAAPAAQGTTATGSTDSTPDREGFIPRQRFDEVNGRMTTAEQQLAEWKQYEWAKSVDPAQLRQMSDWYGAYRGDPGEFLERAYQEALTHPVHGATVKSRVAKLLASMRATEPEPELQPDIPVLNDQGQVVNHAYSASAVKQLVQRAVAEAIGKEVAPLKTDLQTRQQDAQRQEQQAYIARESARVKADVLKLQDAEKHWPAIQAKARELITANADLSVGEACRDAYFSIVFPTLTTTAKDDVLSDLQRKAHAQTAQPGTPGGSAKPKFKSFGEAARYYADHPDEAEAAQR